MKNTIEYTDGPDDIQKSFDNPKILPTFDLTPEGIKEFASKKSKKPVSIYLSVETIEKFKKAAEKSGGRYQTMISDVLDVYTQRYL